MYVNPAVKRACDNFLQNMFLEVAGRCFVLFSFGELKQSVYNQSLNVPDSSRGWEAG